MRHPRHPSAMRLIEWIIALPPRILFGFWIMLVLGFASLYFWLSIGDGGDGVWGLHTITDPWHRFGNAVYFSVVTATTVGYGDLVPLGVSKALAATEGALGFLLFAILISKFVSHKQEIALFNVHKLSFQNAFFTTREGFFIIRRDCDAIVAHAHAHHALNEKSWSNYSIVLQKGQTLMEGILDFYDHFDWYTIDSRREKLLLESVHRTMQRFTTLLEAFKHAGIEWRSHEEIVAELNDFIALSGSVLHRWQKQSPHGHGEWFRKLKSDLEELAQAAE